MFEAVDEKLTSFPMIRSGYLVELSQRYRVMPLTADEESLTLVVSEQSDTQAAAAFRFATGKKILTVLWESSRLQVALAQFSAKPILNNLQRLAQKALSPRLVSDELQSEQSPEDGPIAHFINRILQSAVVQQASDVHFEPYADYYRVRLRIDGVLQESPVSPPQTLAPRIAARLKIISGLDIAECRLPQDGRLTLLLPDDCKVALRVATLPTRWGEKIVLRLLDNHDKLLGPVVTKYPPR